MKYARLVSVVALLAGLAGCGGASSPASSVSPPAAVAMLRIRALALAETVTPEEAARQLMDYAESIFSGYFPSHQPTHALGPFLYRYYPDNGIYLGVVVADGQGFPIGGVYVLGGPVGNSLLYAGPLATFVAPTRQAVLTGTVATGSALAGAQITVLDAAGASACIDSRVTTDANGSYDCALTDAAVAPFSILAVDSSGLVKPMVSLTTAKPDHGEVQTVNITPLTTGIAAQVAPHNDPFVLTTDHLALGAVKASDFAAVKANVATQLGDLLAQVGLDAASFDPVSTAFVGGSHSGVDKLLDKVKLSFENGKPVLNNVLNGAAPSVPLAGTDVGSISRVLVDDAGDFSLSELDFVTSGFRACFSVPAASRISSAACRGIFVDDAPVAVTGGATYLNNGFNAAVAFNSLLTSTDMDGAQVANVELLRFSSSQDGHDTATINLRFLDRNGIGDYRILVVKKYLGTATTARPSNWWVYGNQRRLNIYVRASLNRVEETLPDAFLATFGQVPSNYKTGLQFFIAKPCADTVTVCPNTSDVRYVRVRGPGLPDLGLVYADANLPQSWMSILNATGVIPVGPKQFVTNATNTFTLQRSMGLSGDAAFAIRPNPFVEQASTQLNSWAHPAMYSGQTPSVNWTFDLGKVPAWSSYTFEIFRGSATTTSETVTARVVTPVVPASSGAGQQWHSISPMTRVLASDGAPAASSLTLSWSTNALAERIDAVNVYSYNGTGVVNAAATAVPKGATSQEVVAVGGQFAALSTTTPPFVSRLLQFRYKMLDGSYRDQFVRFN